MKQVFLHKVQLNSGDLITNSTVNEKGEKAAMFAGLNYNPSFMQPLFVTNYKFNFSSGKYYGATTNGNHAKAMISQVKYDSGRFICLCVYAFTLGNTFSGYGDEYSIDRLFEYYKIYEFDSIEELIKWCKE